METKVKEFILNHNFNIDNVVICAVSGGADSLALLNILYKLGYKVVLAHVNHHKRAQSELEEAAMRSLAKKMEIPFELLNYHFDGSGNFHDDSHNARYDFFRGLCVKYGTDIIATAHHLDDQIETVLIKLMEGSNLYGYGGISLVNNDGSYRIIRPLMCLSKSDIYKYCMENNIEYFEDASNQEDDFLRNRLRHHVVPLLKEECDDLHDKVLRYSLMLHEAFDFIRSISTNYLKDHNNIIDIPSFSLLDIAVKKDIISLLLENNSIRRNTNIINDIIIFLSETNGTKSLDLENEFLLLRSYDKAFISKRADSIANEVVINLNESVTFNNRYRFTLTKNLSDSNAKYIKLCYNVINLPLRIHSKNDGDTISLENGTKKVSRVLIDRKVPEYERNQIPIVYDNNNNVLWIYDYLKSDIVYKMKNSGDLYLVCEVIQDEK